MYKKFRQNETEMAEIPDFNDIEVDIDEPKEGLIKLLRRWKPHWNIDEFQYEDKSTGMLNKNYKVFDADSSEAFLLRLFRIDEAQLADLPALQKRNYRFIHEVKLGPKMYCSVKNGMVIEFLYGDVLSWDTRSKIYDMLPQTAKLLAKYHCKSTHEQAETFGVLQQDNGLMNDQFTKMIAGLKMTNPESEYCKTIPSGEEFFAEMAWYIKLANQLTPGRRFVHLDANPTNWLIRNEDIVLIDYDLVTIFYPSADIAWFFLLHCDFRNLDLSDYPNPEYRRKWLKQYLTQLRVLDKEEKGVSEKDVDKLEAAVDVGLLFAYLQCVMGSMVTRLLFLMTGAGEISEDTALVAWEAYKRKKSEYVSKGF